MTYSDSFFEVVSQVVPVVFLALVVEARDRADRPRGAHHRSSDDGAPETALDRVAYMLILGALVVIEVIALSAVAGSEQAAGLGSFVAAGLGAAGVLLFIKIGFDIAYRAPSRREGWVLLAVLLVISAALIGFLVVFAVAT